jgi:hypothetical protein
MSRHKLTDERWVIREINKRAKFNNTKDLIKKMRPITLHYHKTQAIAAMVEFSGRHGYILYDWNTKLYRAVEIEIMMI